MKNRFNAFLVVAFALLILPSNSFAIIYTANLNGFSVDPRNASPGTGFATIDFDTILHTLHVQAIFSDLTGTTTASHIHSPTASPGVGNAAVATQIPTFIGFPLGVTNGTYDHTFDMTSTATWSSTFFENNGGSVSGAENALGLSLSAGTAYFTIHTTAFPGGEIRGFLTSAPVPEPSTVLLFGTGIVGLARVSRRKKPA